jgi:hypothetical protein
MLLLLLLVVLGMGQLLLGPYRALPAQACCAEVQEDRRVLQD